jgi:hypothetical protein
MLYQYGGGGISGFPGREKRRKKGLFHLTEPPQTHRLVLLKVSVFGNSFMKRVLAFSAVVLGLVLPLHANLLFNGSFELGSFVPTEPGSMLLSPSATDITGWTVIDSGLAWDSPANPYGLTASDGSYFLDLTGDFDSSPFGGVQQTVATTIGQQYQLTFDIGTDVSYDSNEGSIPATPVSIFVTSGSSSGTFTTVTPTANNLWESFTYDFTATSTSTLISLEGQASQNIQYIGLDNAVLLPVPEPGTLMLLGGSGLLALVARRRLRKG